MPLAAGRQRAQKKDEPANELRGFPVVVDQTGDDVHRESAPLQEAAALGSLFTRGRRLPVLARKHGARALQLALGGDSPDDVRGDALRLQVVAYLRRAKLARKHARALFGVALVRELLFRRELVEKRVE